MALHSRILHQNCFSNIKRPRNSRVRLQLTCIHKEYSKQGVEPTERPSSNVLLTTPEDIVMECLTLMRKGELSALSPYIPQHLLSPPGAAVPVSGVPVHEQGPLARCARFMDTAARRVLPGHLLRRARIQSSLQLGGSCLLRVSLTACTGEEVVLNWKLGLTQLPGMPHPQQQQQQEHETHHTAPPQQQDQQQHHHQQQQQSAVNRCSDSKGSNNSSSSSWQVLSCERDRSADDEPDQYPKGPHPRTSPELIVLAQLHALRQNDVISACGFNMLGRHASGSGWNAHLTAFRNMLQQPHYHLLASHTAAELGGSALPSQRHFLQEVVLYELSGRDGDDKSSSSSGSSSKNSGRGLAGRFLWRLGMQADGCWMVRSIEVL